MSRMIDLIRQAKVPPNIMRSAAKGALSVPPAEIIEILVYLAGQPLFRDDARMTLAGWDENASAAVAADPSTPKEVLDYLAAPENLRPKLVPALVGNPAVSEETVEIMAAAASQETACLLLGAARARGSVPILNVLASNSRLGEAELQEVQKLLAALGAPLAGEAPESKRPAEGENSRTEEEEPEYIAEHAAEIAAEEGKPFQLVGGIPGAEGAEAVLAAPAATTQASAAAAKLAVEEPERITTIQKIAKLGVGQRVQLALKGNKDERFILIRDGVRVVCCAVLEAPKLSDAEAERFATMKNVSEHVLRGLAGKRKWMKNYNIVRNLAFNPRCPMDVTLQLLKHLMVGDLKHLSVNKDVADTIRKTAMKMWRQKSDTRGGRGME